MTLPLFPTESPSMLHFESQALRQGYRCVAGIDEAGRGPLAGPVAVAAVILPARFELPGLTDSKQLSERERERLFVEIRRQARAVGVALGWPDEIERINILQATLRTMVRAVGRLRCTPDYLLVDGISRLPTAIPQLPLKKGDARSVSIAAASVIAKVVRDRLMVNYDRRFPGYGFAQHKGYGSQQHLAAIAELGPCPIHRKTFRGVREHLAGS
ncbi:MAG: ribonuclease HII [Desulfuromonadaceae bacterium]|nr:ribonuclease HII [Desulfuromonadaceae bacterium]